MLRLLFFFFTRHLDHQDLHSFPTRRSSDLDTSGAMIFRILAFRSKSRANLTSPSPRARRNRSRSRSASARSEEHTSELQSHVNLVCRLLLEKKKYRNISYITYNS